MSEPFHCHKLFPDWLLLMSNSNYFQKGEEILVFLRLRVAAILTVTIYVGLYMWTRTWKWQPTPVFLPGESNGQLLAWRATDSSVAKSRTWLKRLSMRIMWTLHQSLNSSLLENKFSTVDDFICFTLNFHPLPVTSFRCSGKYNPGFYVVSLWKWDYLFKWLMYYNCKIALGLSSFVLKKKKKKTWNDFSKLKN